MTTETAITGTPRPGTCPPDVPTNGSVWFATIVPGTDAASRAVDHVSNVEYVRWLDTAGQMHLADLGWNSTDLIEAGAMWFVGRHEIDYRREARAGEVLRAATWVRCVRRVKSWRDTIVWRETETELDTVCTASTLWVHVDLESRRPVRPPDDMVTALTPLGVSDPPWRDRS